jgi:hypothetical protein
MDANYFREKAETCLRQAKVLRWNNPDRFYLMDLAEDFQKRAELAPRHQDDPEKKISIGFLMDWPLCIGQQLKAQYDVAEPIPDRLAELLEQLAQLEFLKELAQLMDEPDSKGG